MPCTIAVYLVASPFLCVQPFVNVNLHSCRFFFFVCYFIFISGLNGVEVRVTTSNSSWVVLLICLISFSMDSYQQDISFITPCRLWQRTRFLSNSLIFRCALFPSLPLRIVWVVVAFDISFFERSHDVRLLLSRRRHHWWLGFRKSFRLWFGVRGWVHVRRTGLTKRTRKVGGRSVPSVSRRQSPSSSISLL